MNFLRRLLGRDRKAAAGTRSGQLMPSDEGERREVEGLLAEFFGGPDGDRPYVCVNQGHSVEIVDRMTYEYRQGKRPGTDPRQAALDAVLASMDRVRVLDGGLYRDTTLGAGVLLDTDDPRHLAALRRALRISEEAATFGHCAGLGGPTLELFEGSRRLAVIAVHHGRSIRWPRWRHDAALADPATLTTWLAGIGVEAEAADADRPLAMLALKPVDRLVHRAASYLRLEQFDHALEAIEEALERDPACATALAMRAEVRLRKGDAPRAEAELTRAIDAGVRAAACYRMRAMARLYQSRCDEALADCELALELDPEHAPAYDAQAKVLAGLQRLDDAKATLSEGIARTKDNLGLYDLRAQLLAAVGDFSASLADFEHMLQALPGGEGHSDSEGEPPQSDAGRIRPRPQLRPHRSTRLDRCNVLCAMGRVRMQMGDHAGALDALRRACEADPWSVRALETLASLHVQRDEFSEAIELHDRAIELLPDVESFMNRARVHWVASKHEYALDDLQEALDRSREPADIHVVRGDVLMSLGRFEDARDDYDRALELQPAAPAVLFRRSQAWGQLGILSEQLADLEANCEADPENPVPLNSLAWLLATAPDDDVRDGPRAVELARKVDRMTQGLQPNYLDTLAAALAEAGEFDEAVEVERRAIARFKQLGLPVDLDRYRERLARYEMGLPQRGGE